jgi:predicted DNA-binding protein with PD1-like motif
MKARQLDETDGRRTFVLVFDVGDEVTGVLTAFARERHLTGAYFTGIGALRDVALGYWRWDTKRYERIPIDEQVEVVSLAGNIARGPDGGPALHAHIVVATSDAAAHGGHLLEAHVRPTLEIVLTESPTSLQRAIDPETGLALLTG